MSKISGKDNRIHRKTAEEADGELTSPLLHMAEATAVMTAAVTAGMTPGDRAKDLRRSDQVENEKTREEILILD